jgi:hypothetical protein
MEATRAAFDEAITLRQAKKLIQCMAHEQSFLLLSAPGMGKSEMVYETAREAGLPCRSLLATQIAPEEVSGVPRIVGERSVFCSPRILLPERAEPVCLFLDSAPIRRTESTTGRATGNSRDDDADGRATLRQPTAHSARCSTARHPTTLLATMAVRHSLP